MVFKFKGYTLSDLANMSFNVSPTDELRNTFIHRTKKHIALVHKYAKKIDREYPEHDNSKLTDLLDMYCYFSKPKEERTEDENALLDIGTYVHITQAPHHPEYWTTSNLIGFTRANPNPNGIIEVVDMPEEALLEMCCDWCATGDEKGNSGSEWFDLVNGVRWLFSEEQQEFIRETLKKLEEE